MFRVLPGLKELRYISALCAVLLICAVHQGYNGINGWLREATPDKVLKSLQIQRESAEIANQDLKNYFKEKIYDLKIPTKFCVGILSSQRKQNYLLQVVTALITRTEYIPSKFKLFVLKIDERENDDAKEIEQYVHTVNLPNHFGFSAEELADAVNKEVADYANALQYSFSRNCNYHILLEDDALPSRDWLEKIEAAVDQIKKDNFFTIKLLFLNEPEKMTSHILLCIFVSAFGTMFAYLCICGASKWDIKPSVMGCALVFSVILICIKVSGFVPFVSKNSEGYLEYSLGFSLTAALYQKQTVKRLAELFAESVKQKVPLLPKDILLEDFKTSIGGKEFNIKPSVFQHIGLHSSLSWKQQKQKILFRSEAFPDDMTEIEFRPKDFE